MGNVNAYHYFVIVRMERIQIVEMIVKIRTKRVLEGHHLAENDVLRSSPNDGHCDWTQVTMDTATAHK